MEKEPTTSGLKPDKLGELLSICSENRQAKTGQDQAELLYDRLSETLPLETGTESLVAENLSHLCQVPGLLTRESIKNLLNHPQTNISLIKNKPLCSIHYTTSSMTQITLIVFRLVSTLIHTPTGTDR